MFYTSFEFHSTAIVGEKDNGTKTASNKDGGKVSAHAFSDIKSKLKCIFYYFF